MSSQSVEDVMADAFAGKITQAQASEIIKKMIDAKKPITYKVSEKGCISFYGIRKMPISVYLSELNQILETVDTPEFQQFLVDNDKALNNRIKDDKNSK